MGFRSEAGNASRMLCHIDLYNTTLFDAFQHEILIFAAPVTETLADSVVPGLKSPRFRAVPAAETLADFRHFQAQKRL